MTKPVCWQAFPPTVLRAFVFEQAGTKRSCGSFGTQRAHRGLMQPRNLRNKGQALPVIAKPSPCRTHSRYASASAERQHPCKTCKRVIPRCHNQHVSCGHSILKQTHFSSTHMGFVISVILASVPWQRVGAQPKVRSCECPRVLFVLGVCLLDLWTWTFWETADFPLDSQKAKLFMATENYGHWP